jgi:hypothetical protein
MSKETYYEICEMFGNDPDPLEVPVEFSDLHSEVQEAFQLYNKLTDMWDSMSGSYMGKNIVGLLDIMELYEVDDKKLSFDIIKTIDNIRSETIKSRKAANTQKPTQ